MKNTIKYLTALALATLTTIHTTHAGSHTWTGQGITKNWSLPANWVGDYPPAVGEAHITLTFPTVVAAARNSTNNLSGLAVDEIILSGSANKLYGNAVHLTGVGAEQIVCDGINSIFTPLVLDTGYNVFDVKAGDTLYLSGLISGPGGFTKIGAGVLRMEPVTDNSFAGEAKVLDGEMDLKGQAAVSISGPLTIGQLNSAAFPFVFMEAGNQIGDSATVKVVENGFLRLNGFSDTVGALVFQAGGIDTSDPANTVTGVLSLNGNVASLAHQFAGFVRGKLSLNGADRTFDVPAGAFLSMQCAISSGAGTAGIVKTGMGNLMLHNANTYNGFTKVNAGTLGAYHSAALGTIANGTMVAAGATLQLQDAIVGNESLLLNGTGVGGTNGALVLSGTNSWSGTIQLAGDTAINALNFPGYQSASTFSGVINGAGKLIKAGEGTLTLSGTSANTFSGGTWVQGGALVLGKTSFVTAIPGPLIVGSATNPPNHETVRLFAPSQIADTAPIIVNASGLLDLNNQYDTIGSLAGSGNVNLILGALTAGGDNTDTTFSGAISGIGSVPLTKEGTGRMTLTGTNTCSGKMIVNNGDLYVNGSQTCGVQLNTNGKLHGQGTVGAITGVGGWTIPGDNLIAPNHGQLKSGNLSLDSTSDFNVDLGGTAASGKYDRLKVTGTVSLANASLHLTQSAMAKTNDQFIIIENDGADAVSGTFNGLAENAILSLGPLQVFKISYVGGDGNDVVLTQIVTPPPPTIGGVTKLGGGQIEISGSGMPDWVYTVEATEDLGNPNGWQAIGNMVGDANGALKFTDPDAPNHQMRFYRFKAL